MNKSLKICNTLMSISLGFSGGLFEDLSPSVSLREFPEAVLRRLGGNGGGSSHEPSKEPDDKSTRIRSINHSNSYQSKSLRQERMNH